MSSLSLHDGNISVDDQFDEDGDLEFDFRGDILYLARDDVRNLRDHLNEVLYDAVMVESNAVKAVTGGSIEEPSLMPELLDVVKEIRDALVHQNEEIDKLTDETPHPTASLEKQTPDDTPELTSNTEVIDYAAKNKLSITFTYLRPQFGLDREPRREVHVLTPSQPVNVTGPKWDPYITFTGVDDDGDTKTFRLDRIVGVAKLATS